MHPALALGAAVAALAFSLPAQAVDTVYTTTLTGPRGVAAERLARDGLRDGDAQPRPAHPARAGHVQRSDRNDDRVAHPLLHHRARRSGGRGDDDADLRGLSSRGHRRHVRQDPAAGPREQLESCVRDPGRRRWPMRTRRSSTGLNNGTSYFNIHTSTFGGGEIRGFLINPVAAIPEPETYALLLAGLGLLGGLAKRRQASRRPRGD